MVELKRGIYRRVVLDLSIDIDELRMLDEAVWKELPFPKQASFPDGRVAYFILAEAGLPYLAYALFSEDEPRDEKERILRGKRSVCTSITTLLYKKPLRFYTFSYWHSLHEELEDEMRRYIEWAEGLTLEEVGAMLDKLEELEKQQKLKPRIDYPSAEWCLESLKKVAAMLRWLLDERANYHVLLKVGVAPRVDEPGVD
ncbi:MAG: hypothetical protein QXI90_03690 [Thermofilum sp.]